MTSDLGGVYPHVCVSDGSWVFAQIVCTLRLLLQHTACVAASRHSLSLSPLAPPKLSKQPNYYRVGCDVPTCSPVIVAACITYSTVCNASSPRTLMQMALWA
jgi:hypothetical protein